MSGFKEHPLPPTPLPFPFGAPRPLCIMALLLLLQVDGLLLTRLNILEPVNVQNGVRQGCPIYRWRPCLFN